MTVLPILFLFLCALITWLIRNQHNRIQWVVSSILGFTVWALLIFIDVEDAGLIGLSIWQPTDLFPSPINLTIDILTWPLIYGAVTVLLSVILTSATRPVAAQAGLKIFWFLYTSFALIAIMSANLLTTAVAWAIMDFGTLLFLMDMSQNQSDSRAIFIRAAVNAASVLFVVAAAMVSDIQGIVSLDLTSTSAVGILMLAFAASLRLGLIPLHFTLPPIDPLRRGVGSLLRLFPPIVAMALLARVFAAGLPSGLRVLFFIAGGIGGILGALRWVFQSEIVRARPFFVLSLASLGLIVASMVTKGERVVVATGLLMLLVGTVLSLFAHHTPSHRVIPVLTSALLIGVPFTPGGVYAAVVAAPEVFTLYPFMSIVAVLIAALLALGCFHLFFASETHWPTNESLARVMYNVGLLLPVLAAIGVGSWRLSADPLSAGIFSMTAFLFSIALFYGFRNLSPDQANRVRSVFRKFELEQIYEGFWRLIQRLLIALRNLGELFEGVSGMLWLFVFVIFLLFIIR